MMDFKVSWLEKHCLIVLTVFPIIRHITVGCCLGWILHSRRQLCSTENSFTTVQGGKVCKKNNNYFFFHIQATKDDLFWSIHCGKCEFQKEYNSRRNWTKESRGGRNAVRSIVTAPLLLPGEGSREVGEATDIRVISVHFLNKVYRWK